MSLPPPPQPRVLVLLNRRSGTLAASDTKDEPERIARGFAAAGVPADVRAVEPAHLARTLAAGRAAGCTAVVVGGGDGTIFSVANAVAGTGLAFGVLPLGTHNHFAKELGVPDDLDAAVAALAGAVATNTGIGPLDVAEVNGHLFLNFSGVGLHPRVVDRRDADHEEIKRRWPVLRSLLKKFTKPLALVFAFARSLEDMPIHRLMLVADGRRLHRFTPSVIVCTNAHQMEVFGVHEVSVPSRDTLNTYVARTRSVGGVVRLLLAAVTGRLKVLREFEPLASRELTVYHRRPMLRVSLDGEVLRLRTPLRYRVRPAALTVIAPGRATAAGDDGATGTGATAATSDRPLIGATV